MIRQTDAQVFPDRVLIRKEPSREQITNDDRRCLIQPLTVRERATTHERNLHCSEVARVGKVFNGQQDLSWWKRRMFGDHKRIVTPVTVPRKHIDHPRFLYAR